jgi:hypothetical protein
MARESTLKLDFRISGPTSVELPVDVGGITKSAAVGGNTSISLDITPPPATLPKANDLIYITGTGWKSLDGKMHRVVSYAAGALVIATDTFAEASVPVPANVKIDLPTTWTHVCFVDFTPNPGQPAEIDATTMCDDAKVVLPGLPVPGTASFTGRFDLDDAGMQAMIAAEEDGLPRFLVAMTRRGQVGVWHGVVSSFSMAALAVEGIVDYTGTVTLDRKASYLKAA